MKKQLIEFSQYDAINLLNHVFKDDETYFEKITFLDDNDYFIIFYSNGQDMCHISSDDTRVILWLYQNDFEIINMLKHIELMSEQSVETNTLITELAMLGQGTKVINKSFHKNFTIEYVLDKCTKICNKYWEIWDR